MQCHRAWSSSPFGRWSAAILFTYATGFCIFRPDVFTASDESFYVEQAVAFAHGSIALPDDLAADEPVDPVSDYPPGTSLLQTPFVLVGGWRAAAWASLSCLAVAVWALARWLRDAGYAPAYAVLFLAYAPTLVLGRLALSDVPSAAIVTVGLWLFWTGGHSRWRWFVAGLLAGISLLFRETNGLLFLPFFLGALLRREPHWRMLVAGGLAGTSVRLLFAQLLFASPFFVRERAGWSLAAAVDSLPVYALALLVLVPGGLAAVAMYRGRRRGELIATVALFVATYVFANNSGQSSGPLARIGTAGRYFIPLIPLITLAWADAVSRHTRGNLTRRFAPGAYATILVAAFAVHPAIYYWTSREAAIVRDIYASTASDSVLVADDSNRKYISAVYGPRKTFWMTDTPTDQLAAITAEYRSTYLVVASKSETERMAELSAAAEHYVDRARRRCQLDLVHDRQYGPDRRLRIWSARSCNA